MVSQTLIYIFGYLVYVGLCAELSHRILSTKGYERSEYFIGMSVLLGFIGVIGAAGMPLAKDSKHVI